MNYLRYLVGLVLVINTFGLNLTNLSSLTNQTNSTVPLRQSTTTTSISSSAARLNSYFDFFISMNSQPKL